MVAIRLIAGLGNPGRQYMLTRHNAGFWFADALAMKLGVSMARESRFSSEVGKDGDLRLAKPTTFMNDSGQAVAALTRFFGVAPEELLIVHDELDLKPGEAKLKQGGGVAGHNGLRDIQAQLGSSDFWRLRLGVGHPRDSALPEQDVVDYVLKPPRAEERDQIVSAIQRGLSVWPDIARGDMERAMMTLHTKPADGTSVGTQK
ncbi:MAG TPA: aminoacyl-tRNA hydrolase [Casimicrobiaceae bacterium]